MQARTLTRAHFRQVADQRIRELTPAAPRKVRRAAARAAANAMHRRLRQLNDH